MAKPVRMADIAEKLGVSVVTVSKALNGKEGVGTSLRNEIIRTAAEMGYVINSAVSEQHTSLVIGIINSYLYLERGSSFYWSLYERLLEHISNTNSLGVLEVISENDQKNLTVPKLVSNKKINGLIVMGPFPTDYINNLLSLNIPLVFLDMYSADYAVDTVISDGYYGMYMMTDHLIKHGHRKIGFVGTVGETSSITDRFYGYCKAMTEADIKVTDDMVIADRNDVGKIRLDISADIKDRFTALACNCDYTAYEMMKQLNSMDIKVPDDISIVGFDNYILSEVTQVPITTYEVDLDRMAKKSVKQIINRINNPLRKRDMQIINGNIIERDSVKTLE